MATEGDDVKISGESGGAPRSERLDAGRPVKSGNNRSRNSPRPSRDRSSDGKRGRRRSKPRDISPVSSKRSPSAENKVGRPSGHTAHGVRDRNDRRRNSTSRSDSLRPVDRKRPLRSVDNNRASVESRAARKRQVSPRSGHSPRRSTERGGRGKHGTSSPRNVSPRAGRRGISPDKNHDGRKESTKRSTSRDRRGPPGRRGSPYKSPGRHRRQSVSPPPRAASDYRRYASPDGHRDNYNSDRRRGYNNQSSVRAHRPRSRSPEVRRDTRGASPVRYRRGYRGTSRQSDRRPPHRSDSHSRRPKNPRSPATPIRPKNASCATICNLLMEARNSIKERRRDAISSAAAYFDEDEFRGEDWRGSPLEIDQYLDKYFAEFPNPTKVTKRITLELSPKQSFSVEFEPRKQSTITLYECKDGLITRAYIFKDDANFSRPETRMTIEDFAEDTYCGKDVIKYFKKKGMHSIPDLNYIEYKDDAVKNADGNDSRPGRGGK